MTKKADITRISEQIASAVWEGHIDGLQTRDVANRWGISTAQALKILKGIVEGKNKSFPFEYDEYFKGVRVKDGTCFVQGDDPAHSEGHRWS